MIIWFKLVDPRKLLDSWSWYSFLLELINYYDMGGDKISFIIVGFKVV